MKRMPASGKKFSTRVFDAASAPVRLQILQHLQANGPLTYSEIMSLTKMDPIRDAGKFAYHLRSATDAGLVDFDKENRKYELSKLGEVLMNFSYEIEDYALNKKGKLFVRTSRWSIEEFDRNKIVQSMIQEADAPIDVAQQVAQETEDRLIRSGTKYITAPLIREFVNAILIEKKLEEYRHKLTRLGLPVFEVTQRIKEAATTSRTSDSIVKMAGDSVLTDYVLLNVLPRDVSDSHMSGAIDVYNIDSWILKPYEVFHDLRYFLKTGIPFNSLDLLASSIHPPRSLDSTLALIKSLIHTTGHETSGEQTLDYFNVILAPYIQGVKKEELRKQLLLFVLEVGNLNHQGVSLGLDLSIPEHFADITAISPKDEVPGKYEDFEEEAQDVAETLFDIIAESEDKPIFNPRFIVKMRPETFRKKKPRELLLKAHEAAANTSLPYFANLPDDKKAVLSYNANGTLLATNWTGDWEIDTQRTSHLDTVAINIPRIAYESKGNDDKFIDILNKRLKLCCETLELKSQAILERMNHGLLPLLSQKTMNEPYLRLENSSRLITFVGLYEAVEYHTKRLLDKDEGALKFALRIAEEAAETLRQKHNKSQRNLLSQSPTGRATQRMAQLDSDKYGRNTVISQGTRETPYYTDLTVLPLEIDIPLDQRLRIESRFQDLFQGGHLTNIILAEEINDPERILAYTENLATNLNLKFFVYSKDITHCPNCQRTFYHFDVKCPNCKSSMPLIHYGRESTTYNPVQWWTQAKRINAARRTKYRI
jgi:ribonucleoside-triphosphate reductase (formate)